MNYDPLIRTCTDEKMNGLLEIMQIISELKPANAKAKELPMQTIQCLFYIASHDGCHKQALEEDLNMNKASGSRNTDWLSAHHRIAERSGLGLISKMPDFSDRRRDRLFLTRKGKELVRNLKISINELLQEAC
tara:strand:+ start:279 stop:677 length:399 start_codon:yes stop_codon:yes gene_type:complete